MNDKGIISVMVRKSVAVQHCLLRRKYFSQLGGLPLELNYYTREPDSNRRKASGWM